MWGGPKPENIMIESHTGEPVLFDFEGGITLEYVPEDLHDSKEGDLHALRLPPGGNSFFF